MLGVKNGTHGIKYVIYINIGSLPRVQSENGFDHEEYKVNRIYRLCFI